MHRSHVRTLPFPAIFLIAISPLGAQTPQEPDAFDPAFLAAPADLPVELIGTQTQSAGPPRAAPAPVESPAAEFRRIVQESRNHKHQYVHCRLKTGKILTGQIKDAGFEDVETEDVRPPRFSAFPGAAIVRAHKTKKNA